MPIIRQALQGNGRKTALYVLLWLTSSELKQIFDELIFLSCSEHGGIQAVRQAILTIEKEWLLANIEAAVEPYLQESGGEEYRRFLELFIKIDPKLTQRLAHRAIENGDYDAKEAGKEFLDKITLAKNDS